MTDTHDRKTEPGIVLKTYERAKARIGSMLGGGKTDGAIASEEPKKDPVTSGHDWKDKPAKPVPDADRVRSQEERKKSVGDEEDDDPAREGKRAKTAVYEDVAKGQPAASEGAAARPAPGGTADEDDGGPRGEVEVTGGDPSRPSGSGNPAAPELSELDRRNLAKLQEAETGKVPSEGLGIDDGPRVRYPSDTGV